MNKFPFKIKSALTIIISSLFLFFFQTTNALAQNVPPGDDVGAQSRRLVDQGNAAQKTFDEKKAQGSLVDNKVNELAAPAEGGVSFVLTKVQLTGVTVFSLAEMESLYASLIGQKVTAKEINQILESIKTKYKKHGYFTTTAYLPAQDIKDGVLLLTVVEGKMGDLTIEGNRYFSSALISSYIHSDKNKILNMSQLAQDVFRLNQKSDLQLKAVISPGKAPETVDVTLKAQDSPTWHKGVTMDNLGSRLLGKIKGGSYIRGTNVTGRADSLFVSTSLNSRTMAQMINYKTPIDTRGTQLGMSFSRSDFKLGQDFKSFDITGSSVQGGLELTKELYLSESFQSMLKSGLDLKSIKKHTRGVRTANDQLRIPYLGLDFIENDAWGTTTFSPRMDFGTEDFLGASSRNHPSAVRAGTGGSYIRYSQEMTRSLKMPWESYLRLHGEFQSASRTLPSSEQFQLGGESSIRGYPEGDYLADVGGFASVEWNFPMYLIPKTWVLPKERTLLRYQIQPYVFADMGGGMLKKVLPGETDRKTLWSMGGGFRVHVYRSVFLNMDWAKVMGDDPVSGSGSSTFHFSLQIEV